MKQREEGISELAEGSVGSSKVGLVGHQGTDLD